MTGKLIRKDRVRTVLALFAGAICIAAAHSASPPLVVHEWGTFTSFQDSRGRTISGINVDDEPVPRFVHRLRDFQTFRTTSLPASWSQGAPRCFPGVTLRLETPVLYFYPPTGWLSKPFDVRATFNGGWLTEFYPAASTEGMDVQQAVDRETRGSLLWRQVRLDAAGAAALKPRTDSHVWLAPRAVSAALVVNETAREAEKYLFYRGVGNLDAPIVVRETGGKLEISLRENETGLEQLPRLWLVDVDREEKVRFQSIAPTGRSVTVPALPRAAPGDASRLEELKRELTAELMRSGLFADEAAAMLDTWRLSYFESEGLRVFFLLPQQWTDARLPLSISIPSTVTRVMVGRVELVTAGQRDALRKLHSLPDEAFAISPLYAQDREALRLLQEGGRSHAELYRAVGREVPQSLQLYESLGRFRDALLAHEWQNESSAARRTRLERVLRLYGACDAGLRSEQVTDGRPTSAPPPAE
jgi:hypothetical protein